MSSESISRLRTQFEAELTLNPTYYHPVDISRMRTDDWTIRRFLLANPKSEDDAFSSLLASLRWKSTFGVHSRTDDYFPTEWWTLVRAELGSGLDRTGHPLLWGVARNILKFSHPQARLLSKQFQAHLLERMDALAGETGFTIVFNLANTGPSNVDLDLARFSISLFEHYPFAIKHYYAVDLPWILASIAKLVLSLMPGYIQEMIRFISEDELQLYIETKYIPVAMKGEREKDDIPRTVSVKERYEELGLDESFVSWLAEKMEKIK